MTISSLVANLAETSQRNARHFTRTLASTKLRSANILGDMIAQRILVEVITVAANIHSRNTPYLLARINYIDPDGNSYDNVAAHASGLAARRLQPILKPDAFVYIHAVITTKGARTQVELLALQN